MLIFYNRHFGYQLNLSHRSSGLITARGKQVLGVMVQAGHHSGSALPARGLNGYISSPCLLSHLELMIATEAHSNHG